MGFSYADLENIPLAMVMDVFIEQGNDSYNYPIKATADDVNLL